MQISALAILCVQFLVILAAEAESGKDKKLQIGVKKRVSAEKCKIKSRKGDVLHMHYTVTLIKLFHFNVCIVSNQNLRYTKKYRVIFLS
jgi:FK506-binding protein 2